MSAPPQPALRRGQSQPTPLSELDRLVVDEKVGGEAVPNDGTNGSNGSAASKLDDKKQKKLDQVSKPKSLYERIVGKGTVFDNSIATNPAKRQSVGSTIATWFSKESPEERAVRNLLKSYRSNLVTEHQIVTKAIARHRRRVSEQLVDFDKQEKQLYAWGLKSTVPKFRIQAWCRLARARLQEQLSVEIENLVSERQKKVQVYLQLYEESSNRKEKFSLKSIEEFCKAPEALVVQDYTTLCLLEQFQRLEVTCALAAKQFTQQESKFAYRASEQRKEALHSILKRFGELPKVADLENIETDLDWGDFCKWLTTRTEAQRALEMEFSDFIEDQREKEGRLFYRWKSAIAASLSSDRESVDRPSLDLDLAEGDAPALGAPKKTAVLRVTPGSIKAFIRYFATDIIGVTYAIPRDSIQANIALTELLFFRRISSVIFRYPTKSVQHQDEVWRAQAHLCRFLDPEIYHVPPEYYLGKDFGKKRGVAREDEDDARPITPPSEPPRTPTNHLLASPATVRKSYAKMLAYPHAEVTPLLSPNVSPMPPGSGLDRLAGNQFSSIASPQVDRADSHRASPRDLPSEVLDFTDSASAELSREVSPLPPTAQRPQAAAPLQRPLSMGSALSPAPSRVAPCACPTCSAVSSLGRLHLIDRDGFGGTHEAPPPEETPRQRLRPLGSVPGRYGVAYRRASRVLSMMATTTVPREMIMYLGLACKWILRDAIDMSQSRSIIGADVMVPLFTLALINAQIPHMHLLLHVLMNFGDYEEQGDVSYNVASLEGSIMCVMGFALPAEAEEAFLAYARLRGGPAMSKPAPTSHVTGGIPIQAGPEASSPLAADLAGSFAPASLLSKSQASTGTPQKSFLASHPTPEDIVEDNLAMEELGEWLRDQQTMEDTIEILQKDGWML